MPKIYKLKINRDLALLKPVPNSHTNCYQNVVKLLHKVSIHAKLFNLATIQETTAEDVLKNLMLAFTMRMKVPMVSAKNSLNV